MKRSFVFSAMTLCLLLLMGNTQLQACGYGFLSKVEPGKSTFDQVVKRNPHIPHKRYVVRDTVLGDEVRVFEREILDFTAVGTKLYGKRRLVGKNGVAKKRKNPVVQIAEYTGYAYGLDYKVNMFWDTMEIIRKQFGTPSAQASTALYYNDLKMAFHFDQEKTAQMGTETDADAPRLTKVQVWAKRARRNLYLPS